MIDELKVMADRMGALEEQLELRVKAVLTLQAELESAEEHAAALQDRLKALTSNAAQPAADDTGAGADLLEWVDDVFAHLVEIRTGAAVRWCRHWSQHPEAVLRLTAIRQDYDNCLANPQLGISGWLRTSVDHHLPRLTAGQGPFSGCTATDHEEPLKLPVSVRIGAGED